MIISNIKLKRAYKEASPEDGCRILVDRLWPRGISKEHARLTVWAKNLAPSDALRKWFAHDPSKWNEFQKRYALELNHQPALVTQLIDVIKQHKKVTFIYASKDQLHNNAIALITFLSKQ